MKIAFCPYKNFDLTGCEQWITEKAEQGLYMKYFYWPVVFFVEDAPSKTRYHIEPSAENRTEGMDATQNELFESCGWEYLCSMDYGKLYRATNPTAIEPYTDADSKAQSLRSMEKGFKHSLIISMVYILLVGLALVLSFTVKDTVPYNAVCFWIVCAVWIIWSSVRSFSAWQLFKSTRQQLLNSDSLPALKPTNPALEIAYQLFSAVAFCAMLAMYIAK